MTDLPACGCCVEAQAMRDHAADHDLRRACHCKAYPEHERCDCAFCTSMLKSFEVKTMTDLPPIPEAPALAMQHCPWSELSAWALSYGQECRRAGLQEAASQPIDYKAVAEACGDVLNDFRTGWEGTPETVVRAVVAAIRSAAQKPRA